MTATKSGGKKRAREAKGEVTATKSGGKKSSQPPNLENTGERRRQPPVTVASLRLFLRSSTGPNRRFQPQSLGRVRDPVRIAEGPTAIDAATQCRHFGFRLRLVDKLQPIGGGSGRGHPLSGTWATWMAPMSCQPSSSSNRPR